LLANPKHIEALPGRKTDQADSEWIVDLLQHGLLQKSFIPPAETRELRDLTRYRVSLVEEGNRIANRIQKVLEDANIKLASVASNILGVSGRAMLEVMVSGEIDVEETAQRSCGRLRKKIPEICLALEGRLTTHHRFVLRELLDHVDFIEEKVRRLDREIALRTQPINDAVRLCTIPGVSHITAWGLLAEIGTDMSRFPTAQHLASWAGLCPGQNESAGKRRTARTRKGSVWLRRCLCQCAWAVSHKKTTYLSAQYRRLAARRGGKRAVVGVAHALLVIAYHILSRNTEYRDLGNGYFDQINPERCKRQPLKRLERLGYRVTLQPAIQTCS
jgi:transposase